jgi:hypothetical protein
MGGVDPGVFRYSPFLTGGLSKKPSDHRHLLGAEVWVSFWSPTTMSGRRALQDALLEFCENRLTLAGWFVAGAKQAGACCPAERGGQVLEDRRPK